jgi:tetratricopeptide (TPR) repeat protein
VQSLIGAHVAVAASYAQAEEPETAERLLAQAVAALDPDQRAYWDVSARLDLANACSRAGYRGEARTWLVQALALAPRIVDDRKRTTLLELIAHTAGDLEDDDLAWQAVRGLGKGRITRLDARAFHLALIAGHLARRGDYARALQVAETIPDGADKTSALDDLATAYIDAGRYPEALQTVQRIRPPEDRAWAMVWALIRISRQWRAASPESCQLPSVPALLQLIARRQARSSGAVPLAGTRGHHAVTDGKLTAEPTSGIDQ